MDNTIIKDLSKNIKNKSLKYCVSTFGCQMNYSDSDKLEDILEKIGYIKVDSESEADFVLYNTCCIRENAEQKVYGNLGHLKAQKRKNPDLIIALCGCMMQQEHVIKELKKNHKHVDIIFGTFNLFKLPELLQARFETGKQIIDIWETHEEFDEYLPTSKRQDFRASINIMQGCNNFCSYCIVPYVRGRERSREKEDIIREIKYLVSQGVTEITLLGQNVNSYGKTLDEPVSFAQLIYAINEIEGLEWIRFMTSHPKDLSDELIEAMAECDKVCKYIHLPIQSGSSRMLGLMKRRYTKESYLELIDKIKSRIPDIAITTDIIVGFPGETEEDFQHTLEVVEKVGYQGAFTFIYSKRTGTPAAAMEGQVDKDIVTERFNRLIELVDKTALNKMKEYENKTYKVLVDKQSKSNPKELSGRNEHNALVHFEGDPSLIGKYVDVHIADGRPYYALGEIK
ncbi:MAG: tRNA (N6-isopentenyl adenosine(37)-C2)-methylthiotransferase MiaB [Epulopiscium sp.]|nr:tRNA (N6-isopentenyl adenosine(37)-C2)-methylthiotransferase MiaB [Candidatus Epulonipiscium sp.]